MAVLVTGATGFLGKYMIAELSRNDYQIVAFGRNQQIGKQLEKDYPNVHFIQGDLRKKEDLERAIEQCEVVVHAGALSTVWGKWEDFEAINVTATKMLLQLSVEKGIRRFVFVSSPSIYTQARDQFDVKEDQYEETNDLNDYIKSKLLAEACVYSFQEQLETVVIRPRGLFGVGDTSLVPRLIRLNHSTGIPLIRDGNQLIDVTCVENVAYAIRLSIESEVAAGQTYNISNGEPRPFKELIGELFDVMDIQPKYRRINYRLLSTIARTLEWGYRTLNLVNEPVVTLYTVYAANFSLTLSIEKAQRELGYQPIISLSEGIKQYAQIEQNRND